MSKSGITVSLPWNTSNYIPLNAFHPLYGFLLEPTGDESNIGFATLDKTLWYDLLTKNENNEALQFFLQDYRHRHRRKGTLEEREFWKFFDFDEALLDEISSAQLKLVHTTPVQAGNRCFVFHLESFETAFLPWTIESPFLLSSSPEKIQRIRKFLLDIFESPRCLAIVSHVRKTIESFELFFGSDIVNRKLTYCPIGFPASPLNVRSDRSNARFLFTASLHGNPNNLLARGLVPVLKFIKAWHRLHPEDEFVFLSQIPEELLEEVVEDKALLDVLRLPNVVTFDGQFLDDGAFSRLLGSCDFVLLPSYQLHSATILRSMGMGVIPVVTDIREVRDYGLDARNAVIIEIFGQGPTVKSAVFGDVYPLRQFFDQSSAIAEQMMRKILPLREDDDMRREVACNAVEHVRTNFSPVDAASRFRGILQRAWTAATSEGRRDRREPSQWRGNDRFGPLTEFVPKLRPICAADFDCRPAYSPQVDLGRIMVLGNGSHAMACFKGGGDIKAYSLLYSAENYLPVEKFSKLRFAAPWWETTNAAFEVLVERPSSVSHGPGAIKRMIFHFLYQRPGMRIMLKRMGVDRVARRLRLLPSHNG